MFLVLLGANIVSNAQAVRSDFPAVTKCPGHVHGVRYYRNATWHFQDLIGYKHSKYRFHPAKATCGYAQYTARVWRNRTRALALYWNTTGTYINADRDFDRALLLASHIHKVSYSWLHSCASSEGGFREWIPNHTGSKAGGWMQFMSGTFYSNVGTAFRIAKQRGYNIPSQYENWYSRLGQAVTAAYMFSIGQSSQWTGAGC